MFLVMNDVLNLCCVIFDELFHDVYVHPIEQNDDHRFHIKMVFLEKKNSFLLLRKLLHLDFYLQYVFEYV